MPYSGLVTVAVLTTGLNAGLAASAGEVTSMGISSAGRLATSPSSSAWTMAAMGARLEAAISRAATGRMSKCV